MENLKPNSQRAKIAIMLLWTVLTVEIISLLSDYLQYDLLETVANGGQITTEAATDNDLRQKIIGLIYLTVYVISGITFIRWFRRAYYNLHIKAESLSFTEGWAAGCWFVPIISLYRPNQIMKELYQETQSLLSKKDENYAQNLTTHFIGWWWALWIISSFLGQFIFRYSMKAETLEELTTTTIASIFASIIGIPLAIITVKVIKDYSEVEHLLYELKDEEEEVKIIPDTDLQPLEN
ncbi:DUF4328 domain-containing protein [Flavobacterium algoritolerans]|uniref:DUF4328 domain-containing protein n=1 Tax=Flavobacterium algoritolerans TaxID=3041254 RepID=A0ABT6VF86_9FLAO|nr:DUF4328 domain-containing protein [Flavobacterium algoritolerans]MDI5896118.1 DUF4328 domain-containing protein [Flavobacterium algoritolerans]